MTHQHKIIKKRLICEYVHNKYTCLLALLTAQIKAVFPVLESLELMLNLKSSCRESNLSIPVKLPSWKSIIVRVKARARVG